MALVATQVYADIPVDEPYHAIEELGADATPCLSDFTCMRNGLQPIATVNCPNAALVNTPVIGKFKAAKLFRPEYLKLSCPFMDPGAEYCCNDD